MMKDLLTSRKFWAAIVGLALVFAGQLWPSLQLDGEAMIAAIVVIASYILGVAVDPGPGGWRGILLSRKFWAALVGLVFIILRGLQITTIITEDQLVEIALLICSYITAVAVTKPKAIGYGRAH